MDIYLATIISKHLNCADYLNLMLTCKEYHSHLRNKRYLCLVNKNILHCRWACKFNHKVCMGELNLLPAFVKANTLHLYRLTDVSNYCAYRIFSDSHYQKVLRLVPQAKYHKGEYEQCIIAVLSTCKDLLAHIFRGKVITYLYTKKFSEVIAYILANVHKHRFKIHYLRDVSSRINPLVRKIIEHKEFLITARNLEK